MSEDVWTARDTNPDAIEAALRDMLRHRHAENESLAPARVLNLIVIVDREWKGEIANRLERVGRYHASRTVLCAVEEGRTALDATAVMSYEDPKGGLGVMREHVEIDIGREHLSRIDTIVDPVLASDLPTVLWSPHGYEEGVELLIALIDVMLLDSDDSPEPFAALERAERALRSAYVVDLAWLRTTPWRERLAASLDAPARAPLLFALGALGVRHRPTSVASALLLAGWLASRLGWEPASLTAAGHGALRGAATRNGDQVSIELASVSQDVQGLAGVTVSSSSGVSLSLDRAAGGLCARERSADGDERVWQILGASRGEGGILGEGVRQALLRDATYGPALAAARRFCPE